MSHPAKVLHVYVEVRSSADPGAGGKTFGEQERSGLKGGAQDLLSQLSGQSASRRPDVPCRSPSPEPGRSRLGRAVGSPAKARSNRKEGRDGKRSVVSFSYVHKSNVRTLSGPGNNRERSNPLRKRLPDPFRFGSPATSRGPKTTFRLSPSRLAPDPVARTSEDFGSPLRRIKMAQAPERSAWFRTDRPTRCRSWSGSPVPRYNTDTSDSGTRGWRQGPASERHAWRSQSPLPRSQKAADSGDDAAEGLNQLSLVSNRSTARRLHPKESGPASPQQSLKMNIPVQAAAAAEDQAPAIGRSPSLRPRPRRPSRPPTEPGSPIGDPGVSPAGPLAPHGPGPRPRRTPRCTGGDRPELTCKGSIGCSGPPFTAQEGDRQTCGEPGRRGSLSPTARRKQAERRRRERLLLGPVVPDSPDEDREHPLEAAGGSSRSSSGATGTLADRDRLSPESLRADLRGHETGTSTSGIQTDGAAPVLSLHCQKMARAKWEFLFGPEEGGGSGPANRAEASTAPPSGNSSESPTPTPPSSLPPLAATQRVRRVDVELVWSETDPDAVPLRCYRETDMDRLPTDGRDGRDSAFGRGGSPGAPGPRPRATDLASRKGRAQEDDAGEEEEDDEVAGRAGARARTRGDHGKREDAALEEERRLLRIRRARECFSDGHRAALKSPVSLRGPGGGAEDAFSRHFESIVESARAKGTSCRSLDGREPAPPAADSDATRAPSSERLSAGSEDAPLRGPAPRREGTVPARGPDAGGEARRRAAAERLARRLYRLDGFSRADVARRLGRNNEFGRFLADEYLRLFDFSHLPLDQGLREFLRQAPLSGDAPERERLLSHFARRYRQCNPGCFPSEDDAQALTRALLLLNDNLHGPKEGQKMSWPQFVRNLDDGRRFPEHLLKALYNSIKTQKLQWTLDEEELRKSFSELGDSLCDASRSAKGGDDGTAAGETPPCGTPLYKNGFLVRKVHADSDGKRTPRGKRGWKSFYAILKGLILYLQKGEYRADKPLTDDDLKNAVSVHHSLAMEASDYSKRANVFYLRTADWRLFLFQAPNAEQMHSWITCINTAAATLSAPPFPPAVGSSREKFSRPLLPGNVSKLSEEEQARSHEARLRAVSSELAELRSCPPERKPKARQLDQHQQRDQHLQFEKTRYETYVALLRAKMVAGDGGETDLEPLEEDEGALQRAQSSPSLRDGGGTRAGAKPRQDVQRHSYRQAVKK